MRREDQGDGTPGKGEGSWEIRGRRDETKGRGDQGERRPRGEENMVTGSQGERLEDPRDRGDQGERRLR